MRRPRMFPLLATSFVLLAAWPLSAQFPKIPGADRVQKVAETQREWTPEEERQIGEATAAKMIAVFGLYEEPRAVKYVNLVGEGLAQFAPRQSLDYRFAILDTDMVNAFATPGGYVFLTRGLLANLDNEAEFAGVVAHEIIHTSERHLEKELRSRKLGAVAVQEGTGRIPVGELAKLADQMADTLLAGKLSRDKENEADSKALELMVAVGYDPAAYPEFLHWLGEASSNPGNRRGLGVLTASHPPFADRVKRLQEQIAKRGWDKQERARLAERYQETVVFGAEAEPDAEPTSAEAAAAGEGETQPASDSPAAAPATTPATGDASAGLAFRPFSADQVVSQGGKVQHRGKIHMREKLFRMESEQQGQRSIVILRYDRQLMWVLMPAENMYMEMPLQAGRSMAEAAYDPNSKVERELLGAERVASYDCVKYRLRVTSEGHTWSGLQWAAVELNGFVVKMLDESSNTTIEYQNISLAPPDPALFELPSGYRKMTY